MSRIPLPDRICRILGRDLPEGHQPVVQTILNGVAAFEKQPV